jgi:CHAT domain-containing protein
VGLSRAFLSAGAGHVVATLWPVEDRATADLMEHFYERFTAGADAPAALAGAQRALLVAPATEHPFYWAGFVSVGGAR